MPTNVLNGYLFHKFHHNNVPKSRFHMCNISIKSEMNLPLTSDSASSPWYLVSLESKLGAGGRQEHQRELQFIPTIPKGGRTLVLQVQETPTVLTRDWEVAASLRKKSHSLKKGREKAINATTSNWYLQP